MFTLRKVSADRYTFEERPEIVAYAVRALTGDASGADFVLPLSGPEVAQEIAKRWGMTPRMARHYLRAARTEIAEEFAADLPTRAHALAAYSLAVIRDARHDRDWSGVNGAVRNLCVIYGIKEKVTVTGDALSALLEAARADPAARDAEIADLERKAAEGASGGPHAG